MRLLHIVIYAVIAYNILRGSENVKLYKQMYLHLFNVVTTALEVENIDEIKEILKQGQIDTEEMYINGNGD